MVHAPGLGTLHPTSKEHVTQSPFISGGKEKKRKTVWKFDLPQISHKALKSTKVLNLHSLKTADISSIIFTLYSMVTSPEGVKEQVDAVTVSTLSSLIIT